MKPSKNQKIQLERKIMDDKELDKKCMFLYAVLLTYTNKITKQCYPSLETLGRDTDSSKPTVIKRLKVLEDKGYIKIDSGGNGRKSNVYTLLRTPKILKDREEYTINFIKNSNLSVNDKIFCIMTYPNADKNKTTGEGIIKNMSIQDISNKCCMTAPTVRKIVKSLVDKKYLELNNKDIIIDYNALELAVLFLSEQMENTQNKIKEQQNEIIKLKEQVDKLSKLIYTDIKENEINN